MKYRFSFRVLDISYGVGGFETKEKAISGLEQASEIFCKERNLAEGMIFEIGNENPIREYKIRLINRELDMRAI